MNLKSLLTKNLVWFILLAVFAFRYWQTRPIFATGDKIRISSRVSSEPLVFDTGKRIILHGLKVYLPSDIEIFYGDNVVVEGVVDGDKLVGVTIVKHSPAQNLLYKLRNNLLQIYDRSLPLKDSALVSGMVLGSKSLLSSSFWEDLKSSGTAHVVVASGMNVSMVANFLIGTLVVFIPRRRAVILGIVGVWLYSVLSGFDAPIVRAAIMASLGLGAVAMGRVSSGWRALFLSAGVMLIVNPDWISDLGFVLSFAATASLMLFERKFRSLIYFVPTVIREDLSTSLAAQVGVAPILYYYFGQLNLLSPIANALILWTVPFITILGALGGVVGLVVPQMGRLILLLILPLSSWFAYVVDIFA